MASHKFWNDKLVLLTGATGFLGGWLGKRLLDEGARVVVVVRQPRPESHFYLVGSAKRAIIERGSVYDAVFMSRLFDRYQFDACFHAAYGADVNRVLNEPLECFRSSVESTWLMLDLLRRARRPVPTVVSSSDKAYGSQPLPYVESRALEPVHPYEVAKASQDLAAQSYGKVYGLPVAVTRCGNYFGPYDFNFTRLIPGVVKQVVDGQAPTLRSDGRFTRDFLYIEDAVDVQLMLAERLAVDPTLHGEAFNFSYGDQIEVIDIVKKILALLATRREPNITDNVQAEIRHMHLCSDKAAQWLGWAPRVGFDEGLARTVAWYRDYFQRQQRGDGVVLRQVRR